MKKVIIFLMCAFFAAPTWAATCNGGTLITAKSPSDSGCTAETCNGHEFCKSNLAMNWWSAFNWCASQGRKLADFTVMCPSMQTSGNTKEGACPNLHGVGGNQYVWSSFGIGTRDALYVNLSSGAVTYYNRDGSLYGGSALCE